ncbi:MAG: adenosylmethionine--8-amino-7-oxononanoate transaminase [Chitinophagales bacterium]|nr:adenosylmethionine--8-amino-7-oxononanoate transaminase [Chitinophagales bacterium]
MDRSLAAIDQDIIWHPFTQGALSGSSIVITSGKGTILMDNNGNTYIDAISSWWVNLHGHGHPHIAQRIAEQAKVLEQVIFAGFTHEPAVRLAEALLQQLAPCFKKVFYSDNGSTAVEVAIKMALQYWYNIGNPKSKIVALQHAYHGDTFGAMSVGARGGFNQPFESLLFDVDFIDIHAEDCVAHFENICNKGDIAAFIYEPLVQGSAGMMMYSPQLLEKLLTIAKKYNVFCIADEVMTGFYRTGKLLASDYLTLKPDIICLSKGITGGFLPLGVTICTNEIYNVFHSTDKMKTFFHGHSYTANPLSCAAALASLELLTQSETQRKIATIQDRHAGFLEVIRYHPKVGKPRYLGTILAFEVKNEETASYFNNIRDLLYNKFIEKGVLLRPLGNTVYIMPPYCITDEELIKVYTTIEEVLNQLEV